MDIIGKVVILNGHQNVQRTLETYDKMLYVPNGLYSTCEILGVESMKYDL